MKHGPIAMIDETVPVVVVRAGRAVRKDRFQRAGGVARGGR
jgi:glucosamine 6-phosphate synthetase-like amidotransferase/phosphosugar isomerase protein